MNPFNPIQSMSCHRTLALFIFVLVQSLHAGPIPKLFSSGVDDSGALLDDVATASITGSVATDDGNGGIFLNGNRVDFAGSGFTSYTDLNIPAGAPFVAGLNTLDFFANNGGTAANPTGLRVDNLVLSGATVPPPLTNSRSGTDIRLAWPASVTGF